MSPSTQQLARVLVVAAAPVFFFVGMLVVPYRTDPMDASATVQVVTSEGGRWVAGHLVVSIGYVALILAVVAIRNWLRQAGEERWSLIALPFLVIGFGLIPFIAGADGLGLWAAIEAGGSGEAFRAQVENWVIAVFMVAVILTTIGLLALVAALRAAQVFSRPRLIVVGVALVAVAVLQFVPFGPALIAFTIALLVGFWGISQQMMLAVRQPAGSAPPAPSPAA